MRIQDIAFLAKPRTFDLTTGETHVLLGAQERTASQFTWIRPRACGLITSESGDVPIRTASYSAAETANAWKLAREEAERIHGLLAKRPFLVTSVATAEYNRTCGATRRVPAASVGRAEKRRELKFENNSLPQQVVWLLSSLSSAMQRFLSSTPRMKQESISATVRPQSGIQVMAGVFVSPRISVSRTISKHWAGGCRITSC